VACAWHINAHGSNGRNGGPPRLRGPRPFAAQRFNR